MDAIVLDKISKSFHGKEVLKNFSAVFPMGETTCIMAPSEPVRLRYCAS
ncbi:MAG: hypothetical protein ACLUN5_02110 [Oscillospiraceae bacterium]